MSRKNKWEKRFDAFLNTIEFQLVKYPDGWGLIDKQGAGLGGIEGNRFDDALGILDRLDIYIDDYFASDIEDALNIKNGEYGDWSELIEIAREKMTPEKLEYHRFDLEILDMICNHPAEVALERCFFSKEDSR